MTYIETASIAVRVVLAIKLHDQNLNGLGAKVSPLMSLQSVERLQPDQAAD